MYCFRYALSINNIFRYLIFKLAETGDIWKVHLTTQMKMFWRKKDTYVVNKGDAPIKNTKTVVVKKPVRPEKANDDEIQKILKEVIPKNEAVPEGTSDNNDEPTPSTSKVPDENDKGNGNDDEKAKRREGVRVQAVDLDQEIKKYEKSEEAKSLIKKALLSNEFLQNILKEDQLIDIIDAMQPRNVETNEVIIKQGESGDVMFVSESGRYNIIINDNLFDTFTGQRVFGELAIMFDNPRLATIQAISPGKVWTLQGSVFKQITVQNALAEVQSKVSFLRNVPSVNKASDRKLTIIASLLKFEFFTTDTVIVKQGDKGDKFYIIKAGNATVTKDELGVVTVLKRGAFFGEHALLEEDARRKATVTANSPGVECLYLSRQDFIDNLGDITDFLRKEDTRQPTMEEAQSEFGDVEIKHLRVIGTLGVGGFGRVDLVQHRQKTDQVFALKILIKRHLVEMGQRQHVLCEKIIQKSCNSEFIVRLYKTYQDRCRLYYLMECCLGGDLFGLLQKQPKRQGFEEKWAQFLSACVLEGLAYIHERDYIYRDLKPENIMIDSMGYAKITDFGFAKQLMDGERTYTFAGTPEYVAPEIMLNKGYTKAVDFWAFGILIFELSAGRSPFRSNNQQNVLSMVQTGIENVIFPTRISKHAQSIIKNLCRPLPEKRIGCKRKGVDDIRGHKWYSSLNWTLLRERAIKSPFAPKLQNNCDTSYFGDFSDENEYAPEEDIWEEF